MHRLIHYTTIIVLVLLLLVTTSVARPRGNNELFTVEKKKINTKRKPARSPLSTNKLQRQLAEMKKKMPNINVRTAEKQLHRAQDVQTQLMPVFYQLSPKPTDAMETVNLLWSGGVASTYRLCKLLFVHKRIVRPVYFAQNGLDSRKSTQHERLTVRELYKYIHTHHPSMKKQLLAVEMFDAPLRRNEKNRVLLDSLAFIFQTQPYRIAPFYLALATFRDQMHKPHTNVSNRPLEIVLPAKGPLLMLRKTIEKWGTRERFKTPEIPLSNWFGDSEQKPIPSDENLLSKCTYVVKPLKNAHTNEHQRRNAFAKAFEHIRFILPCDNPFRMHHLAKKHSFLHILKRTWSCRAPVMTRQQLYHKQHQKNQNRLIPIPDVPTGQCGHCVSCRQRMWDGVRRVND